MSSGFLANVVANVSISRPTKLARVAQRKKTSKSFDFNSKLYGSIWTFKKAIETNNLLEHLGLKHILVSFWGFSDQNHHKWSLIYLPWYIICICLNDILERWEVYLLALDHGFLIKITWFFFLWAVAPHPSVLGIKGRLETQPTLCFLLTL